jgi:hypothetical protein
MLSRITLHIHHIGKFITKFADFNEIYLYFIPTDGVSTLLWRWGLSAPETLRAMPAVV